MHTNVLRIKTSTIHGLEKTQIFISHFSIMENTTKPSSLHYVLNDFKSQSYGRPTCVKNRMFS